MLQWCLQQSNVLLVFGYLSRFPLSSFDRCRGNITELWIYHQSGTIGFHILYPNEIFNRIGVFNNNVVVFYTQPNSHCLCSSLSRGHILYYFSQTARKYRHSWRPHTTIVYIRISATNPASIRLPWPWPSYTHHRDRGCGTMPQDGDGFRYFSIDIATRSGNTSWQKSSGTYLGRHTCYFPFC